MRHVACHCVRAVPRTPRRFQQGEYHHVVNRGSLRAQLFYSKSDYELFIELLAQTAEQFRLPLLAYCVMPNHWHLVTSVGATDEMSDALHWLTSVHAMRWCRTHERRGPGPVYQSRFRSVPIQPGISLFRVVRYVERNALAARLADLAESWPWGSAYQRLRQIDRPRLESLDLLAPDEWRRYLNDPTPAHDIGAAIRRNLPIGDDAWIRSRRERLGLPEPRRPGRPCKN